MLNYLLSAINYYNDFYIFIDFGIIIPFTLNKLNIIDQIYLL